MVLVILTVTIIRTKSHGNVTCGQLLTFEGSVKLHPLQLEDAVLVPGFSRPRILVEDVVTGEGVLRT